MTHVMPFLISAVGLVPALKLVLCLLPFAAWQWARDAAEAMRRE